jgi:hypothetical protein
MTVLRAEFEQRFSRVLKSRAATASRGTMQALDPHPERHPEQDGRSPPRRHRRDLSPGPERLFRRPGPLEHRLEAHHTAQSSRGAKLASRQTGNGPGQPPVDTIRRGEDHASAIVRGSYRNVCHRCPHGNTGVDPGPLEQLPAENTARLTTPSPVPADTGSARPPDQLVSPLPSRPCAGLPHRTGGLERASMSAGPTDGWSSHRGGTLRRRASPCGSCAVSAGPWPTYHPCQPCKRATTARGVYGASPAATRITSAERTAYHARQYRRQWH